MKDCFLIFFNAKNMLQWNPLLDYFINYGNEFHANQKWLSQCWDTQQTLFIVLKWKMCMKWTSSFNNVQQKTNFMEISNVSYNVSSWDQSQYKIASQKM